MALLNDPERRRRRLARLRQELDDEGVDLVEVVDRGDEEREGLSDADVELVEEILIDELLYARQPPVHEGRRPSYGCIVLSAVEILPDVADELRVIDLADDDDHEAARSLANGMTT